MFKMEPPLPVQIETTEQYLSESGIVLKYYLYPIGSLPLIGCFSEKFFWKLGG